MVTLVVKRIGFMIFTMIVVSLILFLLLETDLTGDPAARVLGQPPERVFKTLVVALNNDSRQLVVAVVPVSSKLDLKVLASAAGAKHAAMADARDALHHRVRAGQHAEGFCEQGVAG